MASKVSKTSHLSKSRGRPRKDEIDESQDDKRARGRQAQKNYMARKQAESNSLRRRIALLEDSIEGMSNAFISYSEQTTPHIPPPMLASTRKVTESFLLHARKAQALATDEDGSNNVSEESLAVGDLQNQTSRPITSYLHSPDQTPHQSPLPVATLFGNFLPPTPKLYSGLTTLPNTQSGSFSPRLTYGFLKSPSPSLTRLHELWTHYSISGRNSFARRLYITSLNLIIQAFNNQISLPGFIPSMLRYRLRHEAPDEFIKLASGQLSLMSLSDHPKPQIVVEDGEDEKGLVLFGPSHPTMTGQLRTEIYQDIQREVQEDVEGLKQWLDCYATQEHLFTQWGLRLYSAVPPEAQAFNHSLGSGPITFPVSETSEPGFWGVVEQKGMDKVMGDAVLVEGSAWAEDKDGLSLEPKLQLFAVRLIEEAVCFGEGPRFLVSNVDRLAMEFLLGTLV